MVHRHNPIHHRRPQRDNPRPHLAVLHEDVRLVLYGGRFHCTRVLGGAVGVGFAQARYDGLAELSLFRCQHFGSMLVATIVPTHPRHCNWMHEQQTPGNLSTRRNVLEICLHRPLQQHADNKKKKAPRYVFHSAGASAHVGS